jgi:CYTH domain-containing protein
MDLPKYALFEHERRFLVDPARCPALDGAPVVRIEDLYIAATRLRLRRVTGAGAAPVFKLCRKYLSDDPVSAPITNLYLTAEEFAQFDVLPGHRIAKCRYRIDGLGLDVFEGRHAGLIIAEIEAPTRAAVLAQTMPVWAAREVTGDPAFSGAELARTA